MSDKFELQIAAAQADGDVGSLGQWLREERAKNARLEKRAQRAEAECERLRALADHMKAALEFIAEEHDAGRHDGLPEICPAHDEYVMWKKASEALATPPPEGEQWEYYYKRKDCPARYATDPHCICWYPEGTGPRPNERHDDAVPAVEWRKAPAHHSLGDAPHTPDQPEGEKLDSDMQEVLDRNRRRNYLSGEAKQAHGGALAAFERLSGGFSSTVEQDKRIVRKALTASGVPYVPEEVRRLPDEYRERAKTCMESAEKDRGKGDHDIAYDKCHRAELYNGFADRLESALASAPADGWPDRFYEAVGWTLAECCAALDRGEDPRQMEAPAVLERCKRDLSRDAAAPSDGGSDE